jgi:hypothetical protein
MLKLTPVIMGMLAAVSIAQPTLAANAANISSSVDLQPTRNLHAQLIIKIGDNGGHSDWERDRYRRWERERYERQRERQIARERWEARRRWERERYEHRDREDRRDDYSRGGYNREVYHREEIYRR